MPLSLSETSNKCLVCPPAICISVVQNANCLCPVRKCIVASLLDGLCRSVAKIRNHFCTAFSPESYLLLSDLHNYFLPWQSKIFLGFDRSKDHSKAKYFLGFVLVLPKQQIIVQVRLLLRRSVLVKNQEGDRLGDNKKEQRFNWTLGPLLNSAKVLSEKQCTTPSNQLQWLFRRFFKAFLDFHADLSRVSQTVIACSSLRILIRRLPDAKWRRCERNKMSSVISQFAWCWRDTCNLKTSTISLRAWCAWPRRHWKHDLTTLLPQ